MKTNTYIAISEKTGKFEAFVKGHLVGSYSTQEKALVKMYKYAKSQNL